MKLAINVMKLVFAVAIIAQQTRIRDQTFEGVVDPNRPPVPAVQPRSYVVLFDPIILNHRNMLKTRGEDV